jgi:hypothetical protein
MKVWTCNDFQGLYPVGSAAVIVAETEVEARKELDGQLWLMMLKQDPDQPYHLVELPLDYPNVVILVDGNY